MLTPSALKRSLLSAVAASAAVPATAAACPAEDLQPTESAELGAYERSVVCLINQERTSRGRVPVRGHGRLALAATRHARDMVRRSYFSHVSPNGTRMAQRLRSARYMIGARRWQVGEILAWGAGPASTPRKVVRGFMKSPTHRAVILTRAFREIGPGAATGTPQRATAQGATVAVEFGRRR
jgi:uncharacterized protein YkwD